MVENIPAIPLAIAEKANQYGEFRSAGFADWDPVKREMLIITRFADVPQIDLVKMPGGARTQSESSFLIARVARTMDRKATTSSSANTWVVASGSSSTATILPMAT